MQKIADWGLQPYAWPTFRIRARDPEIEARYGKDETVIRRGDALYCDAGILYLRYYTDHAEWAYVLKPGETDAPAGLKKIMAEGNRLQDIYASAFKAGLSGNKILAAALDKARQAGIPKPKIYSHSIGYFLHQPGPLIGLPWEQADTGARGEVVLVPDSLFTAELSVTAPLPEWGGREFTMALEQVVAFTAKGLRFAGGRQTQFYLIH
jgi:Xaa-Pro aminopeptidase